MVRIRVAARVFPEDEYLKNIRLGKSIAASIKDEKRLVVIVREPYQWQIGTLLLEIKRAYESCYGRELPTVKYLKDADDFDISPRSYVSDVLLDEGRAQTDASDQRVTVNVVSEQGRVVREGSVAVGNQLEDPQFRLQLEQTSRPPVPTFPGLPSSLGKRPLPYADETNSFTIGGKRAKHIEIPETHNEEHEQDLVSSIEHDEAQGSIELVRDTQYSNSVQVNTRQQTLLEPKDESSELRRSNVPATGDELEELSEPPPHFVSGKKTTEQSIHAQGSTEFGKPHQPLPSPTQTAHQFLKLLRGPITPPSETSGNQLTPANLQQRRPEDAPKSAAQLSSASSSKFKRNDIYDYPESDIDDSQMSPRSRQGQLRHRKSDDRLSRIECLESPQNNRGEDQGLSISQAIDTLDDESVFGDDRPLDQSFKTPEEVPSRTSSGSADGTETSIYEDLEMGDNDDAERNQETTSRRAVSKASANPPRINGDTDTRPSKPAATPSKQHDAEMKTLSQTTNNKTPKVAQVNSASGGTEAKTASQQRRERRLKYNFDATSVDGDVQPSVSGSDIISNYSDRANATKSAAKESKSIKKAKASRRTPSPDSAGEQLSQSLQESTVKLLPKALDKKLPNEQKTPQNKTPGKKNKQLIANGSPKKAASDTPDGVPLKQSVSNSSAIKKGKKSIASEQASSLPHSVVVQRAEQEVASSPVLSKPLPHWGSDTPTIPVKNKSAAKNNKDRLDVDEQADPRKSPSVGIGLTAEERKTMESRKNMTKEQYEAEKKRKQQEAKKQSKHAAITKKSSTTEKIAMDKTPQAKEAPSKESKPATVTAKNKLRKSLSSEEGSQASLQRNATDSSVVTSENGQSKSLTNPSTSGKAKAGRRESTGASSSQASNGPVHPPKTPAKAAAKSPSVNSTTSRKPPKPVPQPNVEKSPAMASTEDPSVKSVTTNKTPKSDLQAKSSAQQLKADKPPNKTTKQTAPAESSSTKSVSKLTANTPAKTSQVTKPYKLTLSELHKTVRNGDKDPEVKKASLLSQIKQAQKPSGFMIEDDDDASDSSDSSEEEEEKPKAVPKAANKVQSIVQKKQAPEDDEDEESSEEKEVSHKTSKDKHVPPSTNSKGKVSGRPDPSIRDKSIESSDEDEDDDDDEL